MSSDLSVLARAIAERVRQGAVRWQRDVIAFDGALVQQLALEAASAEHEASAIAAKVTAILQYWVASEPFAFDEAGIAWRHQHDALLRRIRTLRAWQGDYRAVQGRLAHLNFELDSLLTREGDRRADAENAALERGDAIPTRAVLVAA